MKYFIIFLLLYKVFVNVVIASNSIPVTVQKLEKTTPSTSFFRGKVFPLQSAKFGVRRSGVLTYTASVGDIVYSQIKDKNGKIVRPGNPIIKQQIKMAKIDLEEAKNKLEEAEGLLKNKEDVFNRYFNLNKQKKNIIPLATVELAKTDLDTAKFKVKRCEFEYEKAKMFLERSTVYSKFTGQVAEVYYGPGNYVKEHMDILKVTMMDPIGIEIELPLGLANRLSIENIIKVYDLDSNKPVQAYLSKNLINPSKVKLLVDNQLIPNVSAYPNEEKLPVVNKVLFAIQAYICSEDVKSRISNKKVPIAVPISSIHKDNKGYFVWKASDQQFFNNNELKSQFKVEKIYIIPGDIVRNYTFFKGQDSSFQTIKENARIKPADLIVVDMPEGIKDGDKVAYQELIWRFTVDEEVVITISGLDDPGYYVPFTAIFNQGLGNPQVCISKNGVANFVSVKLTGYHDEYIRIENNELKDGDLVVLDKNDILQEVYEGAKLNVNDVTKAPEKLNHNVAKPYKPVTEPIAIPVASENK